MADNYLMRNALDHMLSKFKDRKPDHALFTSFNFSSSFFENNVLPLLCGDQIDDIKGELINREQLNERLANIHTVVVCDRSAHPEPKSNLRYGLLTVGLQRGRFHPKIILMAGTLGNGEPGLWLSVGSGNLSYSGWGIQREVVGTKPVTRSDEAQLRPLLSWMLSQAQASIELPVDTDGDAQALEEEGKIRVLLKTLLDALERHCIPDEQDPALPTLHLALPPDVVPGHPALLSALTDDQQWENATIISPFWGGVPQLMGAIKAKHFQYVPSWQQGGYGFPATVADSAEKVSYLRFAHEAERYTHAKALLLDGQRQRVLCIGSANFTTAALLHGAGYLSNVEAMLRYRVDDADPWAGMLVPLARGEIVGIEDSEEGAPALPPFDADVLYDWQRKQFHCRVQLFPEASIRTLILEAGSQQRVLKSAFLGEQRLVIKLPLRQPVRTFKLTYTDANGVAATYIGLVTQVNAADDELGYSPRPRLNQVLEYLHGLDPASAGKPSQKGVGIDSGIDGDGDDNAEPIFDFFSFFLGTEKMRRYYENPKRKADSPYAPTACSIPLLHRAVTLQTDATPEAKIGRYVQLAELRDTIDFFDERAATDEEQERASAIKQDIDEEVERLEAAVGPLFAASPQWQAMFAPNAPPAQTFLQWFRTELKLQQGNP